MDKTLESFLHPHRKPNVKFRLPAFDGEFEMRELTVDEMSKINKEAAEKKWAYFDILNHYAAEALVTPDLHNAQLQDALSDKAGHKIISVYDAYRTLFTGPESTKITGKFVDIANLSITFNEKIETAKN